MKKQLLLLAFICIAGAAASQCGFIPVGPSDAANPGMPAITTGGFPLYTESNDCAMAFDRNGTPYVIGRDNNNGGFATVKKFDGTSWVLVGNAGFTSTEVAYIDIEVGSDDVPYITYVDMNTFQGFMMKYNGTSWVQVGTSFSTTLYEVPTTCISVDNNGIPYVGYFDAGQGTAKVKKFVSGSWQDLGGSAGAATGFALYLYMALDKNGDPFITYRDLSGSLRAVVKKFNGTSWSLVGSQGFSNQAGSNILDPTLSFAPDNTPYIAYAETFGGVTKPIVQKFNGTAWVTVGGAVNTGGRSTKIVIDSDGIPYVCYTTTTPQLQIKKFVNNSWVAVGGTGSISVAAPNDVTFLINKTGTPYVNYRAVINNGSAMFGTWTKKLGESIATINDTKTEDIVVPLTTTFKNNCQIITTVKPSVTNPINGSTTAKVWLEATQPTNFVKRHYEITPASNATTATAKVTLYFTQQEFGDYNVLNNTTPLPINSTDIVGISRLRIEKREGISSDGSGLPGTYSGAPSLIDPVDTDIIWNVAEQRWEVSFDVTGFSGFFAKTASALPLTLLTFNALKQNNNNVLLQWQTENEINVAGFDVEVSADGSNFIYSATITANNTLAKNNYAFIDKTPWTTAVKYYRLRKLDKDGRFTYSQVIKVAADKQNLFSVYPNPASNYITIQGSESIKAVQLIDATGRIVKIFTPSLNGKYDVQGISKGVYQLRIVTVNSITNSSLVIK